MWTNELVSIVFFCAQVCRTSNAVHLDLHILAILLHVTAAAPPSEPPSSPSQKTSWFKLKHTYRQHQWKRNIRGLAKYGKVCEDNSSEALRTTDEEKRKRYQAKADAAAAKRDHHFDEACKYQKKLEGDKPNRWSVR